MRSTPARNEVIALEYHFRSVLKSSEKGDIQLVVGDDGRLYVRRYREISPELFQRLQRVSSPYIERLTEQSSDETGAYFISEYIEGTPASERTFAEREAVRALLELCAAIKALHKAGIIHRDIKPANLICGADGHIRLIDFDSARLEKTYQSHDTEPLGTAGFAPPEQYGFTQTDSRSDIYSFGMTMREILGDSADKPKFRCIINRCTQFDPERRYSNINAVGRAVKRASRLNFAPFAVAGVIIAAGMVLFLRKEPPPAPPGIVRLSETADTEITMQSVNTAETETPTAELTQEPPIETAEFPTTEASKEQTTQTPDFTTSEQSEPVPEITDPTKEEIILQTTESTMEYIPATIESTEPERTPNILSDSINPNKITFETVQDDDGLYEDIFDYVFYDDPAVHGEWRLCGILSPDTD
ncbi:MAG: protein kinase, partial [Oscillospiraceae bacterium]